MVPVLEQFVLFGIMICVGFAMGLLIDAYQLLRWMTRLDKIRTNILDLLIWMSFAAAVFYILLQLNFGAVRYFIFIALGLGMFIYFIYFSDICRRGMKPVLKIFVRSLSV
ncbi:MAG: hypothetical protein GX318_07675, partial [Clostridia bacterium]|nr:hypothetical protein [Clostridia bacterium]